MNPEFRAFVEANPKLVSRKESVRYPGLFMFKYARKVFYDALWNVSPYLLQCRGLVLDADWNVVVRPFTKIFNYQENSAGLNWLDDEKVLVTKKVNGFMASLTNYKGTVLISTTGSLDSDFVDYSAKYLRQIPVKMLKPHKTYMFEIVHPDDPHIIEEPEGAHLLAVVDHDSGLHSYKFDLENTMDDAKQNFPQFGVHVDDEPTLWLFGDLKTQVKLCRHEGYVIINPREDESCETLKIKSPYYLFKKFLARVGVKRFEDGIRTGTIKQRIAEEYYPVITRIEDFGVSKFLELEEQERLELLRVYINEIYIE